MMSLIAGIGGVLAGPCAIFAAIVAGIVAIVAICGCVRCMRCIGGCKMRDCGCCKRFLRVTGQDEYDDFELMMMVHKVGFDVGRGKQATFVQVTAGAHCVSTDSNSNGIFQQPLHITVEQGTKVVTVNLLDSRRRPLATLELDIAGDVLDATHHHKEHCYNMKQKGKGVINPMINLTLSIQSDADVEKGLLTGVASTAIDELMRMQLRKAREKHGGDITETQVLKLACSGPLETFHGLGKTEKFHVAIVGPPNSRRWILGMWHDEQEFDASIRPFMEVDMMRIQSILADPDRHHVFAIHYFDETRMPRTLTFRRVDRARDVWVETLVRLMQKIREGRQEKKTILRAKTFG